MLKLLLLLSLALFARVNSQCVSENDNLPLPANPDMGSTIPFSLDLLKRIVSPSGNFFFSPYSIWTALSLAYFASSGNTKTEMERVLRLSNRENTLALYKSIDQEYGSQGTNSNYTISAANRIYVQEGLDLKQCLHSVFQKEIRSIDFKQSEAAAATINQFVKDTTRGKIPELVTKEMVREALTVLVNAVYFKGFWKHQFESELTKQEEFFRDTSTNAHSMVDMMHQNRYFRYGESDSLNAQILEMPYRGDGASMLVFLPRDKGTGRELDDMIRNFDMDSYSSAVRHLRRRDVILKLPKFKFETSISNKLKQALIQMGINDLFSANSDLSNFVTKGRIGVSDIIHKAVVEVDEEGAEAAAATALIGVGITSVGPPPPRPVSFICNRPFLFLIRDNELNNLLFVGTYRL